MSALMASSKLNGWSETGLAFGIQPPLVGGVAHSSLGISSERASAVACSACCYDLCENVGIFPVVMTEGKLRQIQRQVFFADLMEGPHHPRLQQAPEAVQVRRVDIPTHILTFHVIDRLMGKLMFRAAIAGVFIR